jgi:D-alanine-D-alanine ligase-like ATP-grasp enzyme
MRQLFLSRALVKETGILTRDDKWEPKNFQNTERGWDHSGTSCPEVRAVAEKAWAEMQALDKNPQSHYGKVDVRLNKKGETYVIDMNPNGYLGLDGTIATCWKSLGSSYSELVEELIKNLH